MSILKSLPQSLTNSKYQVCSQLCQLIFEYIFKIIIFFPLKNKIDLILRSPGIERTEQKRNRDFALLNKFTSFRDHDSFYNFPIASLIVLNCLIGRIYCKPGRWSLMAEAVPFKRDSAKGDALPIVLLPFRNKLSAKPS